MRYVVDCRAVQSFEDLIDEFNKGFISLVGGKWNGNLDALNDYLSWPEQSPYDLTILGAARCSEVLNFKANERHEKALWPLIQEILADNQDHARVELK